METNGASNPEKFYDENERYVDRRTIGTDARRNYLDEVIHWKIKYLCPLVPKHTHFNTIVEVGCATGDLIGNFPISADKKYGIDISPLNIEFAQKQYPNVSFHAGTFQDFIESVGEQVSIDIVLLSDVLEHVDDDASLLKSAGKKTRFVLVNIPLEKCWESRNRIYGKNDVAGHLRAYSLKDAQKLIDKAGLETIASYVKFFCKEPLYLNRLPKRSLTKPHTYVRFIIDNLFYRWYRASNLFALLSKN